jgi:hypothetical protein
MELEMSKIVILDNAHISMWVYPERKMIHHVVKQYLYGAPFRDALDKGTDALKLYKAIKWLSNDQLTSAVPKEDEEWAKKFWFPRTKSLGWKHWAIVPPQKVIGTLNMERIGKEFSEHGINTRLFDDADEAMKWLEAQ